MEGGDHVIEEENHVEEANHEHGIGDVLKRQKLVKPESFDLEAAYQGPGIYHRVNIYIYIYFLLFIKLFFGLISEKFFKVHIYMHACRV